MSWLREPFKDNKYDQIFDSNAEYDYWAFHYSFEDPKASYKLEEGITPMMNINFPLENSSNHTQIKIQSLDSVLGYIGGIYAIIWAFFGCTVHNYNSF